MLVAVHKLVVGQKLVVVHMLVAVDQMRMVVHMLVVVDRNLVVVRMGLVVHVLGVVVEGILLVHCILECSYLLRSHQNLILDFDKVECRNLLGILFLLVDFGIQYLQLLVDSENLFLPFQVDFGIPFHLLLVGFGIQFLPYLVDSEILVVHILLGIRILPFQLLLEILVDILLVCYTFILL